MGASFTFYSLSAEAGFADSLHGLAVGAELELGTAEALIGYIENDQVAFGGVSIGAPVASGSASVKFNTSGFNFNIGYDII